MTALLIILTLLQAADVYTTAIALMTKKGHEANPVMSGLMQRFGVIPTLLVSKLALSVFLWWLYLQGYLNSQYSMPALAIMALFYGWVVVNNWRIIK